MHERPTSNALVILGRLIGDDSELRGMIEEERVNAEVAREIYELRTNRGLSRTELAEMTGIRESAIAELENADYEGDSLRMLRRIAGFFRSDDL